MYFVGLAFIFPMIASPDGINSSPLGDLIGFWLGTKPKEYYNINTIPRFIVLHGFGLVVGYASFQGTKKKMESIIPKEEKRESLR